MVKPLNMNPSFWFENLLVFVGSPSLFAGKTLFCVGHTESTLIFCWR